MEKLICGELEFKGIKYKFDYRNNILVLIPQILDDYAQWRFEHLGKNKECNFVNIEGRTNTGNYICFIHVRFSEIGSGALQAFVPGYAICRVNGVSHIPKLENIEEVKLYGECIDKFYYPKKIIDFKEKRNSNIRFELDNKNTKSKRFEINKDTYTFGIHWNIPHALIGNQVLGVYSYLDLKFKESKNIDDIVEYYLKITKFFCFINNRRHIKFEKFLAYKKVLVDYGIENEKNIQETTIEFEIYFVDPDEEFDIDKSINAVRFEDVKDKKNNSIKIEECTRM